MSSIENTALAIVGKRHAPQLTPDAVRSGINTVGKYKVDTTEPIASGGNGVLVAAIDPNGRRVAIKLGNSSVRHNAALIEREAEYHETIDTLPGMTGLVPGFMHRDLKQ